MSERIIVNGVNREMTDEEQALVLANRPNPRIGEIELELQDIQAWFTEHDYKVHKIALGEWSIDDPRRIDYLVERTTKRELQDALKEELSTL